jgi:hypothetical protein
MAPSVNRTVDDLAVWMEDVKQPQLGFTVQGFLPRGSSDQAGRLRPAGPAARRSESSFDNSEIVETALSTLIPQPSSLNPSAREEHPSP